MAVLIALTVLPLLVILLQQQLGLPGFVGYSAYKIAFIVPPLVYCRKQQVSVRRDIFQLNHWRNGLVRSIILGIAAIVIFWSVYWALGDLLLDKQQIIEKIEAQFSVTAQTVLLIAPFTIFFNSLLEEFFYRGFTFGLLVKKNAYVGYTLPALAFTIQHVFFFREWLDPLPFLIATFGLLVFALVLQKVYATTRTLVAVWLIHMMGDLAMMGITVSLLL